MHVWPGDDEEIWYKDDLIFLAKTDVVSIYRISERFLQPEQYIIDRYCLNDEIHWHWNDNTRVFSVLELVGMGSNTEEGIQRLLASLV